MKTTTLNTENFMEWYEDTFSMEHHHACAIVTNVVAYAKKHEGSLDVTSFLRSILPDVTAEEISKFLVTEISNLPDGYKWKHNEDGSGCIEGNGRKYFSYDREPYLNACAIEYQVEPPFGPWMVFEDGFKEFISYAEREMRTRERENIHAVITCEYYENSVEFSTGYLDIPCTDFHMSMLDAVELYQVLQRELNGDYVFLVKDPVIEGETLVSGTVCEFDEVLSIDDRMEKNVTITAILEAAEAFVTTKGNYKLIRLDRYEKLYDNVIHNGEMMHFII